MKNTLICILFAICMFSPPVFSQTLTSSSNPVINDLHYYHNSNFTSAGSAGMNQYWDFSALLPVAQTTMVFTFNHSMGVDCFPSDMVSQKLWSGGFRTLAIQTSNSDMYCKGAFYSPSPSICYSNEETLITYPFKYGSSFTDTWNGITLPAIVPQRTETGSSTVTADGTGTLITPGGTYTNVLRIHYSKTFQTILAGTTPTVTDYQEETYSWFYPGIRGEILSISNITSAALSPTQTLIYRHGVTVGLSETAIDDVAFSLFPNPSKDKLYISYKNPSNTDEIELIMYSALGQEVFKQKESLDKFISADVSSLDPGIYFVKLYCNQKLIGQTSLVKVE